MTSNIASTIQYNVASGCATSPPQVALTINKCMPKISILIINYNGKKYLNNCIKSVLNTDYSNFEIFLVDNCSDDDSIIFVKKNYPKVKIFRYDKNLGYALACNEAIRKIDSDYFIILNNDVTVDKDWIKEFLKYIDSDHKIAALTSKIFFMKKNNQINSCGGLIDKYGFGLNRGNGEIDNGEFIDPQEVFYAVGTAMMIKRSAWLDIGEFDPDYFAYFEDLDWSWRARLKGYKILFVPSSIVYHYWRGSFSRRDIVIFYYTRNRLMTIIKNYSLSSLFRILPLYACISLLESLWIISKWTAYDFLAFTKAFLWNLKNIRRTLFFRHRIQCNRILSDDHIQDQMMTSSIELTHICRNASKLLSHPFLQK